RDCTGNATCCLAGMDRQQKSPVQEDASGQSLVSAHPARQSEDTNVEIVSANLRALETVYFTAMLEEARLFDVMDRLLAMFRGVAPADAPAARTERVSADVPSPSLFPPTVAAALGLRRRIVGPQYSKSSSCCPTRKSKVRLTRRIRGKSSTLLRRPNRAPAR